jgi:hypothetical protein
MIRIGTGCGTENDRVRPAGDLAKEGKLDYLVFESLAERTIALAQLRRLENPEIGYSQFLKERFEIVLKPCYEAGTKIITNMGAANPKAAGAYVRQIVNSMGYQDINIRNFLNAGCDCFSQKVCPYSCFKTSNGYFSFSDISGLVTNYSFIFVGSTGAATSCNFDTIWSDFFYFN